MCEGIQIINLDNPIEWTILLLKIVHGLHPQEFKFLETNFIDKLFGSDELRLSILSKKTDLQLIKKFESDKRAFAIKRKNYLIY